MRLEDLNIYQSAMSLGDKVWELVESWDSFAKFSIGKQLVDSVDSIAANISEGYGRYHYKEAKNFYYYARGSLFETKTWIQKASNRHLITKDEAELFLESLNDLGIRLNNFIKATGTKQINN